VGFPNTLVTDGSAPGMFFLPRHLIVFLLTMELTWQSYPTSPPENIGKSGHLPPDVLFESHSIYITGVYKSGHRVTHVPMRGTGLAQGLYSLIVIRHGALRSSRTRHLTYFNTPQLAPQGLVSKPHSLS